MKVRWVGDSWEEYLKLIKTNKNIVQKINRLIEDIKLNGADKGIGKPEALKHNYSGYYSRRIDRKNRLIYYVYNDGENDVLAIFSCTGHYGDK